jgi:sortase (surface protein transpeptidase)
MDLGLDAEGSLEVPPDGFPAGWFTGAPTPGETGPAVVAGHVDWAGSPGVFADLNQLAVGDDITVDRQDGSSAVFRVSAVQRVGKDAFPTAAVYGDLDHAGLRLITCGGEFDRSVGHYRDNVVVFADLVSTRAA